MGAACSGKSDRPAVVVIPRGNQKNQRPPSQYSDGTTNNKFNDRSFVSENRDEDDTNFAHIPAKNVQQTHKQETQAINHENKSSKSSRQNTANRNGVLPHQQEKKEVELTENDEDAFMNQIGQKQDQGTKDQMNVENKEQSKDMFALNFPANNFAGNKNTQGQDNVIPSTERRRLDLNKNKDKKITDIINNADDNENSFSSPDIKPASKKETEFDDPQKENRQDSYQVKEETKKKEHIVPQLEVVKKEEQTLKFESASPSSGHILKDHNKENPKPDQIESQIPQDKNPENQTRPWETNVEKEEYGKQPGYDLQEESSDSISQEYKQEGTINHKKEVLKDSRFPWEKKSDLHGTSQEDENEIVEYSQQEIAASDTEF